MRKNHKEVARVFLNVKMIEKMVAYGIILNCGPQNHDVPIRHSTNGHEALTLGGHGF